MCKHSVFTITEQEEDAPENETQQAQEIQDIQAVSGKYMTTQQIMDQ